MENTIESFSTKLEENITTVIVAGDGNTWDETDVGCRKETLKDPLLWLADQEEVCEITTAYSQYQSSERPPYGHESWQLGGPRLTVMSC
jgi:hypothetical protein